MEKSKAELFYEKHLERVRQYNKEHRAEINEKSKQRFQKIKADPVAYKEYLAKKAKRYKELNPKPVLPVKEFE